MLCGASYKALCDLGNIDIKTAEAALRRLRSGGWIVATNARNGRTSSVPIYRLTTPEYGVASAPASGANTGLTTPINGAATGPPCSPKYGGAEAISTPVFPGSTPKNGGEAPPKTGVLQAERAFSSMNPLNPCSEPGSMKTEEQRLLKAESARVTRAKPAAAIVARPADVSEQTWADWCRHRKDKKAPVTETVLLAARRAGERLGWTLERVMQEWVLSGYQGFKADWFAQRQQGGANGGDHLPAWRREQRARMQAFAPGIAVRDTRNAAPVDDFFDVEVKRVK